MQKGHLLSDVPVPIKSRAPVQKGNDEEKAKRNLGRRSNLAIIFMNIMPHHEPIELPGSNIGSFGGQIHFPFASFQEVF